MHASSLDLPYVAPRHEDAFARVSSLGTRLPVSLTVVLAILLHGGMAGGAAAATVLTEILAFQDVLGRKVQGIVVAEADIEVEKEQAPEPVKDVPPPDPPKDAPVEPKEEAPAAAPAAAQAGAVLTAPTDPNKIEDFSNDGFISGSGSTFAGGTSAANGTSTAAVRNVEAKGPGVTGGTGTAPAGPKVSKARAASQKNPAAWTSAPFPPEADQENIDSAKVTLRVTIRPDGTVEKVQGVRESSAGFGRAAATFARSQKFEPALDDDGNPIGATKDFAVSYDR